MAILIRCLDEFGTLANLFAVLRFELGSYLPGDVEGTEAGDCFGEIGIGGQNQVGGLARFMDG